MMMAEQAFQTMKMMYNPEMKYGRSCCGVHNLLGLNISGVDHALPMAKPKTKVSHCNRLFREVMSRKLKTRSLDQALKIGV